MAVPPTSHISFFSGGGALDRAVSRALHTTRAVCYVENEVSAVLQLAAGMEAGDIDQAPVWGDVGTFPGSLFRGRADMAIGGFPCTDISLAGAGAGIHGDESGLFFALADAVRVVRPRYVFMENVAALTFRGVGAVLGKMAEIGFDTEYGCLRASDVGASHRRDRWWCLAWDRGRLAEPPRFGRPQQSFIDDGGRPLGGALARTDGRALDGHAPARVQGRDGVDPAGETGLRGGPAVVADSTGRGRRVGQPVATATPGGASRGTPESVGEGSDGPPVADGSRNGLHIDGQQDGGAQRSVLEPPQRHDADGCGPALGDGSEQRLQVRPGLRRGLGQEQPPTDRAGSALDGNAEALADGLRVRSSGSHRQDRGGWGIREVLHSMDGIPEWPPLPDDTDGWRSVLARYPGLAPALPQSLFRGVADVGARGDWPDVPWAPCDCNRSDRLRGLGNSVCTAQAEVALRVLWFRAFGEWPA